jgi:hypothetical protein
MGMKELLGGDTEMYLQNQGKKDAFMQTHGLRRLRR